MLVIIPRRNTQNYQVRQKRLFLSCEYSSGSENFRSAPFYMKRSSKHNLINKM